MQLSRGGFFLAAAARAGRWMLLAGLLAQLLACAPPQEAARKRFFWPPGSNEPKIEYVGSYVTDQDVLRGEESVLAEIVFGREWPRPLFLRPQAVASDGQGRVFVADIGRSSVHVLDLPKHRIRKLQEFTQGSLHEFAGGVWGLAVLADGSLYAAVSGTAEIAQFGADEKLIRRFSNSHLKRPLGIAVDERRQRLYAADSAGHQVVFFSLSGEYLGAWGERGTGNSQFNYPLDVAVDGDGLVYVLDAMNARVKVFTPDGSFVRAFGERGTAQGSFMMPKSLAISPQGDVYISDALANKIVVFDREGDFLLRFGGYSVASSGIAPGGLSLPAGIAIDRDAVIWVVDSTNRMIHRFQYLTPQYLSSHPILPGDSYLLPGFLPIDAAVSGPGGEKAHVGQ